MTQRIISFAGSSVAIEYQGDIAHQLVDFLFRHVPTNSSGQPHQILQLISNDQTKWITLTGRQEKIYEGESIGTAAEFLMGHTIYNLADKSSGGLLIHAAGLEWKGKGILLPGKTGAGKTTMTAWLLKKGLGYLTDELVFIPEGTQTMHSFTRPLNLKNPSIPIVEKFININLHQAQGLQASYSRLIPSELVNGFVPHLKPHLQSILFPTYKPDSQGELKPLTKAQTGLHLMKSLINARNLPGDGFPECVRLAGYVAAYRCEYDSFSQIEKPISDLLHKLESDID